MFGLSWGQIAIIVLVGVFVLGPERIPTAVTWVLTNLRKLRSMAAGAQAELRKEIGPELDELRRQVADLQSLKEIQELRDLRDLHPKRLIGKNILGDEFSGGITGFLGLNQPVGGAADPGNAAAGGFPEARTGNKPSLNKSTGGDAGGDRAGRSAATDSGGAAPGVSTALNGSTGVTGGVLNGRAPGSGSTAAAAVPANGAVTPPHLPPSMAKLAAPKVVGGTSPHLPPSTAKLAAPNVVGGTPLRVAARALDAGDRPPFDPDGT